MSKKLRLKNCSIFNDLDAAKTFLETLVGINEPLDSRLASFLELTCRYGSNPDVVKCLLLNHANPYYLDIDSLNSYDYLRLNENKEVKVEFRRLLDKYGDTLLKGRETHHERNELITRIQAEERRRQKLVYGDKNDEALIGELLLALDNEHKHYS